MLFNRPSTAPTSNNSNNISLMRSSENFSANNPNQPNPNNTTSMFVQPSTFGIQSGGGSGLFGNIQPAESRFNSSLRSYRYDIRTNGTVELIGFNQISQLPKNREGIALVALTARDYSLLHYSSDEMRMADYFHLKNNTLTLEQKSVVNNIIRTKLNCFGSSSLHSHFPGGLPPNLAVLFNEPSQNSQPSALNTQQPASTSGALFTNSQPSSQSLITNNTVSTQPFENQSHVSVVPPAERKIFAVSRSKNPDQRNEKITQGALGEKTTSKTDQSETKASQRKAKKSTLKKDENKISGSNPGSFSYEFNKMLFVSGLVQIMEKHNMTVPENLLDNTDFVPQLLEFLREHNISLPTENIPQFQIKSAGLITEPEDEKNKEENLV